VGKMQVTLGCLPPSFLLLAAIEVAVGTTTALLVRDCHPTQLRFFHNALTYAQLAHRYSSANKHSTEKGPATRSGLPGGGGLSASQRGLGPLCGPSCQQPGAGVAGASWQPACYRRRVRHPVPVPAPSRSP
jgi:hypothetical protein